MNFFKENRPLFCIMCFLSFSCKVFGEGTNNSRTLPANQDLIWWRNAIIYRVHQGFDTSTKGLNVYFLFGKTVCMCLLGFVCFADIKENLQYIHAMGVTAIWLSANSIIQQKCTDNNTGIFISSSLEDLIQSSRYYSLRILLDITSTPKGKLPRLSEYSDSVRCWLLSKKIDGISFSINHSSLKGHQSVKNLSNCEYFL